MPSHPKSILLIRHGHTSATEAFKFSGATDHPLIAKGAAKAELLRPWISHFQPQRCYSSPLTRCIHTHHILFPNQTPVTNHQITELNFGDWEDLTYEEIFHSHPFLWSKMRALDSSFTPPNGESMHAFIARIRAFQGELEQSNASRIAITTHAGVIRMLLCLLLNHPPTTTFHSFKVHPLSAYHLSFRSNRWSIQEIIHP